MTGNIPSGLCWNKHAMPGDRVLYHINMDDISNSIPQAYQEKPGLIMVTKDKYENLEI